MSRTNTFTLALSRGDIDGLCYAIDQVGAAIERCVRDDLRSLAIGPYEAGVLRKLRDRLDMLRAKADARAVDARLRAAAGPSQLTRAGGRVIERLGAAALAQAEALAEGVVDIIASDGDAPPSERRVSVACTCHYDGEGLRCDDPHCKVPGHGEGGA